jgi:hypothetical protein
MSYKIGKKEFKTKTTITNYFSYILKNVKEGTILDGTYLEDVLGLLEYHTERDEKIGCGIDYIKVEKHIDIINGFKSNTSHFHIYRKDGTNIDFSYRNCVNNIGKNGYKSKKRDDVMKSFRFVVRPQIDKFRTEAFGKKQYLKCEVLNINFSKKTCHIDHKPPKTFINIVENFLEFYKLDLENIITLPVDNIYNTIADKKIRDDWYSYHLKHAELRAIHKTANLAQAKSKKLNIN